jgi:hypothetical protein
MTSTWRSLALVFAVAGPPSLAAQAVRELGGQVLVTASDPALVTGGLYAALRVATRVRLAATLGAGGSDSRVAGRGELLAHFLLSPRATDHPGVYLGGGVAGVAGPVDQGYVVVLVGLEAAPSRPTGWALEGGFGGGFRVTAGWRWRWQKGRK